MAKIEQLDTVAAKKLGEAVFEGLLKSGVDRKRALKTVDESRLFIGLAAETMVRDIVAEITGGIRKR